MRATLMLLAATLPCAAGPARADVVFQSAVRTVESSFAAPNSSTQLGPWDGTSAGSMFFPSSTPPSPVYCFSGARQTSNILSTSVEYRAEMTLVSTDADRRFCNQSHQLSSLVLNFTLTRPTQYEYTREGTLGFNLAPTTIYTSGGFEVITFLNVHAATGTLPAGSYVIRILQLTEFPPPLGNPLTILDIETMTFIRRGVCCRGATCTLDQTEPACVPLGNAGAVFVVDAETCLGPDPLASPPPCCHADYDKINGIAVSDIFAYLNDWFAGSPLCVVGGDGQTGAPTVQSIFDFLNVWFAGCA